MHLLDLTPLLKEIAKQYQLDPNDTHGLSHWARVLENGLKLADEEGGDKTVITLFAIFHDACRRNQSLDPGHGARGAALAEKILSEHTLVSTTQLVLLSEACRDHTDGQTAADLTVQICWDADRLDLARAGIMPDPVRLCTPTAKTQAILDWANGRALQDFTPHYVVKEWQTFF
jgi:uncharacterized protein